MKKNFMKVIAIVLCLMMAIPAASLFVGAEEAPKWEGEIATEFAGGKGTAGDPFQITTGDHLALLSDAINYGVDGVPGGDNISVEADGNYKIQLVLNGDAATINLIPA